MEVEAGLEKPPPKGRDRWQYSEDGAQDLADLFAPHANQLSFIEYGEKMEASPVQKAILGKHAPLMRVLRKAHAGMSFKQTDMERVFCQVFEKIKHRYPDMPPATQKDWCGSMARRTRTMCRHLQIAMSKDKNKWPAWVVNIFSTSPAAAAVPAAAASSSESAAISAADTLPAAMDDDWYAGDTLPELDTQRVEREMLAAQNSPTERPDPPEVKRRKQTRCVLKYYEGLHHVSRLVVSCRDRPDRGDKVFECKKYINIWVHCLGVCWGMHVFGWGVHVLPPAGLHLDFSRQAAGGGHSQVGESRTPQDPNQCDAAGRGKVRNRKSRWPASQQNERLDA